MNGFYSSYKEQKAEQEHQEDLKKQYDINDENVIVVEKRHLLKFTVHTLSSLIKVIAAAVLFILAGIGLLCLYYSDKNIVEILQELNSLLPFNF